MKQHLLQIIQKAGDLTFATLDYTNHLQARYDTLLQQSSCTKSLTQAQSRPVSNPSVLQYIRVETMPDKSPPCMPFVALEDGSEPANHGHIKETFTACFEALFSTD